MPFWLSMLWLCEAGGLGGASFSLPSFFGRLSSQERSTLEEPSGLTLETFAILEESKWLEVLAGGEVLLLLLVVIVTGLTLLFRRLMIRITIIMTTPQTMPTAM